MLNAERLVSKRVNQGHGPPINYMPTNPTNACKTDVVVLPFRQIQNRINNIRKKDWIAFARDINISEKRAFGILEEFQSRFDVMKITIQNSFLPFNQQKKLIDFIEEKLEKTR